MTNAHRYWIAEPGGQPQGPYDIATLQTMAQEGRVSSSMQACLEGGQDWMPLSNVIGAGSFPASSVGASGGAGGWSAAPGGGAWSGGAGAGTWTPASYVGPILVTIFCCLIGGIVSIIYTAQANTKAAGGDIAGALQAKKTATIWMWVSFAIGIAIQVPYLIFVIIAAASGNP